MATPFLTALVTRADISTGSVVLAVEPVGMLVAARLGDEEPRLMRWKTPAIVALSLFGPVAAWADQPVSASPSAREALTLCASADGALPAARMSILSLGQQRAEEAVRENPQDPMAHFALFCNLGKRAGIRRGALGFFAILGDVGRIRREIDYTLALAPDYPAALAAKGQMLTELPVLFGGDPEKGRRLLQRAASLDPNDSQIRSLLADSLTAATNVRSR